MWRQLVRWAPLAASGVALAVSLHTFASPDVLPATAPADVFSAERAVQHLDVIAREPRPVGSPGHVATRAYLVQQLKALGLSPEVQNTVSALRFPGAEDFGVVSAQNVVVRLPGTASRGAVVLNGHYDGGSTGPAAADCGACVITLLEVLRAVRAGPPLAHDLIAVFSDAEEVGDLGAHAFATQHPWMRDVRLALNFEAMGSGGPASLYVTSPGNRRLIAAFARHAPGALSSSFTVGLFNATPDSRNACDLQDYVDAGSAGMGFIFAGNTAAYHTVLDSAAALDQRSVQHFGDYALGLTRHFANGELDDLRGSEDAVFFTVWPGVVLHYSSHWARPLMWLALAAFIGLAAVGVRRHRISLTPAVLAAAAYLLVGIASASVAALAWWSLRVVTPNLQVFLVGHHALPWYYGGLLAVAAATSAGWVTWLSHRLASTSLALGAMSTLAVAAGVTAVWFPAWSYLFVWPVIASVPWLALEVQAPGDERRQSWRVAATVLASVVLVTMVAPIFVQPSLFVGFMVRLDSMSGMPFLAVPTLFASLVIGCVLPLGATLRADPRGGEGWWVSTILGVAAVALLATGTARSGFSVDRPRPEHVRYELDANTGQAEWVTNDMHLGAWTAAYIPSGTRRELGVRHGMPGGPVTFRAPAPIAPLSAPEVRISEDEMVDGLRVVRLHLWSPRGAPLLEVRVGAATRIMEADVAGQPLDLRGYAPAERGALWLNYAALPAEGVDLTLRLSGGGPIRVALADNSDGLPTLEGRAAIERPRSTMPTPGATWDGTVVRRVIVLADH